MGVSLGGLVPVNEIEIGQLAGRRIAIDTFNTLYQFLSIIRDRFTGEPLRDSSGRITSHLSGLFYRTARLLENSIQPVFVFDGEPPPFKKETTSARAEARRDAEAKWREAVEKGEAAKVMRYAMASSRLTDDMIEESKTLLELMGVSWVQAPSEGEAEAVHLLNTGKVWAVGSQDWDSVLFGAKRLVRNLTISERRKVPGKEKHIVVKPELVELNNLLKTLGISQEQLICLGILIGTDYNPGGVKGIGPKTALKVVKEKGTFDGIFSGIRWEFDVSPHEIFEFFKNPPVGDVELKNRRMDAGRLADFMEGRDFSRERIENTIKKFAGKSGGAGSSGLGRFFVS